MGAAGAIVDGRTMMRGHARGLDADAALRNCDSYTYFDVEGGLLRTGLTGTNVMDIHVLLCDGSESHDSMI
jgi:glycerate-2-kinase